MSTLTEVLVPDIGGAHDVTVIELLVAPGKHIAKEDSLITLESDKATMEIPSPYTGVVKEMKVRVGDTVSQGALILTMETEGEAKTAAAKKPPTEETAAPPTTKAAAPAATEAEAPPAPTPTSTPAAAAPETPITSAGTTEAVYASPSVRRLSRELGANLNQVTASGPKNRITKEDLYRFVKARLGKAPATTGGLAIASAPTIDFSQFGAIETQPLNRIKKLTGANVHRSWVTVPHVTQFGEADITELEAFREQHKAAAEKQGYKLTPLVFIMKAVAAALTAYPHFNSSLDAGGEQLILKKYLHIGVAVDTPNGLVVPVVRDVDKKGLQQLAQDLATLSAKARNKGLTPLDMQGGCFTISSLGGIGGTAFTPIVNAPEVAILGVSKASIKPVFQNDTFVPRLMLPLSLSYDHRVIDGADGARFITYLSERLADIRTLLL